MNSTGCAGIHWTAQARDGEREMRIAGFGRLWLTKLERIWFNKGLTPPADIEGRVRRISVLVRSTPGCDIVPLVCKSR